MATKHRHLTFLEFFAGGGMARLGLGPAWTCLFANDMDRKKASCYAANFQGAPELVVDDVRNLPASAIPGPADLAWASFPCQDLSLAGAGRGLKGEHSSTFWPFWGLVRALDEENRAPRAVVLENVYGAVTSHHGQDFAAIAEALARANYRLGAFIIDAVRFVPQSRPRLFILGVKDHILLPAELLSDGPALPWHPQSLLTAFFQLSRDAAEKWVWWRLGEPSPRLITLEHILEPESSSHRWHTPEETSYILGLMSQQNLAKVHQASVAGRKVVGTLYRRTRRANGRSAQRAEVRFDGIAGCLRTPQGGSSRQTIIIVDGKTVRTRLLSAREAARLMGLPETYVLPQEYNAAYHVAGDGLVVPVVGHLANQLLEPILAPLPSSVAREAA